jgi:hypothetical protein
MRSTYGCHGIWAKCCHLRATRRCSAGFGDRGSRREAHAVFFFLFLPLELPVRLFARRWASAACSQARPEEFHQVDDFGTLFLLLAICICNVDDVLGLAAPTQSSLPQFERLSRRALTWLPMSVQSALLSWTTAMLYDVEKKGIDARTGVLDAGNSHLT